MVHWLLQLVGEVLEVLVMSMKLRGWGIGSPWKGTFDLKDALGSSWAIRLMVPKDGRGIVGVKEG